MTVLFFVFDCVVFAQAARSLSTNSKPDIVKNVEKKMKELTHDSGVYFKRGLLHLRDRHKSKARQEFDKAVEVFLLSGIKIRGNQKLRECYNQLIETIYRIEFFSNQKPFNVRGLAAVCGWSIEESLVGEIFNNIVANRSGGLTKSAKDKSDTYLFAGFTEQKFEPSPLDELAKFDFTENEENIITREATKEYLTLRKVAEKKQVSWICLSDAPNDSEIFELLSRTRSSNNGNWSAQIGNVYADGTQDFPRRRSS